MEGAQCIQKLDENMTQTTSTVNAATFSQLFIINLVVELTKLCAELNHHAARPHRLLHDTNRQMPTPNS